MLDNLIQVSGQPNVKLSGDKSSKKEPSNDSFEKYMQEQSADIKNDKTLKSKKQEKKQDITNDKTETKTIQKSEIKSPKDDNLKGELNPNEVFGTLFHILKIAKDLNLSPNLSAPIRELKEAKTVKDIIDIAKKYNLNITKIEFSKDEEKLDIKTALNDKKTAPKIMHFVDILEQKTLQNIVVNNQNKTNIKEIKQELNQNINLASILGSIDDKKPATNQTDKLAKIINQDIKNPSTIKDIKEQITNKNLSSAKVEEKTQDVVKEEKETINIKNDEIKLDKTEKVEVAKTVEEKIETPKQETSKNLSSPKIDEKLTKTEKIEEKVIQTKQAIIDDKNEILQKISDTNDEKPIINKSNIDGEKLLGSLLKGLKNTEKGEKQESKINSLDEFVKTVSENKTKENKPSLEQFFNEKYQNIEKTQKMEHNNISLQTDGLKINTSTELKESKVFVKETLPNFANDLKEVVEKYRPPVSRVKINLNPAELGEIEVSVSVRGNNLNIQLNSQNQTTTNLFIAHQIELRNTLVAMGFSGLDMSFSQKKEENENQKKNQQNRNKKEDENEENENLELNTINLNVPLSNFELKA